MAGCTSNNSTDTVLGTSGAAGTAGVVEKPESAPQITADLAGITKQNVAKIAPTRLADGLVPPTNRWFSGLVYGDQPQPVFPMPLSAALTDTGFAIGLPNVTASEKTIMGGNNPQIQVPLGAAKMQVTAYDTLSVTSTYSDASGNALGSVKLVQGSPFVTYTAAARPDHRGRADLQGRLSGRLLHHHGGRSRVRPGGRRRRHRRCRRQGDPEVRVDHDAVRRRRQVPTRPRSPRRPPTRSSAPRSITRSTATPSRPR